MKIVEQVRDLIKEGKLKPGDKLPPEQMLAEKFGTSRPSVREALSALENFSSGILYVYENSKKAETGRYR